MTKRSERPGTVALNVLNAGERALNTGKLKDEDEIPGTGVTVEEAKKNWAETNQAFNQKRVERRQKALAARTATPLSEASDIEFNRRTQTTIVTPGVLANIELQPPTLQSMVTSDLLPDLPSTEELKKMEVEELITLAGIRGVDVKANVDDKDVLIAKLEGWYVEPEKDDLTGKTRGELETIAGELGLEATNKDVFPNVNILADAIRAKRAQDNI